MNAFNCTNQILANNQENSSRIIGQIFAISDGEMIGMKRKKNLSKVRLCVSHDITIKKASLVLMLIHDLAVFQILAQ